MEGQEVTTNGKRSTKIEIDVINGKDIPDNKDSMKVVAHSIAIAVKDALKDKNEYDNYTVLFMQYQQIFDLRMFDRIIDQ